MISIIAIIIGVVILIITTLSHMCEKIGRYYYGSAPSSSNPNTYIVFGRLGGFKEEKLDAELKTHGFKKIRIVGRRIPSFATFVWTSLDDRYKFSPLSFKIQCQTKNVIEDTRAEIITRKDYLYLEMARNEPDVAREHFAQSWNLKDFKWPSGTITESPWFIVRPIGGTFFGGKDIFRITNEQEYKDACRFYHSNRLVENVLVSEYLDDPYLYEGRKFHLRLYFMIRIVTGKPIYGELWGLSDDDLSLPRGKILTAKLPYVRDHIENGEIHDTHAKSTPSAIFFPTMATAIHHPAAPNEPLDVSDVRRQLRQIADALTRQAERAHVCPYPESQNAFEIFGLDLLVVRKNKTGPVTPRVVLLEVNDRVGYDTPDSPLTERIQDDYFRWVWNFGIQPTL